MKQSFNILFFLFAFFAIVGSAGVTSYEHICKKEGKSISLFIPKGEEAHSNHGEHSEKEVSCCHSEKEDNCCSENIKFYKVDFDHFHTVDLQLPNYSYKADFTFASSNIYVFNNRLNIYLNKPPPEARKDFQASFQTYLI